MCRKSLPVSKHTSKINRIVIVFYAIPWVGIKFVVVFIVVVVVILARYLSHGQEWSEKLRIRAGTRIIKYTLDPVWDEEFTLPVRR